MLKNYRSTHIDPDLLRRADMSIIYDGTITTKVDRIVRDIWKLNYNRNLTVKFTDDDIGLGVYEYKCVDLGTGADLLKMLVDFAANECRQIKPVSMDFSRLGAGFRVTLFYTHVNINPNRLIDCVGVVKDAWDFYNTRWEQGEPITVPYYCEFRVGSVLANEIICSQRPKFSAQLFIDIDDDIRSRCVDGIYFRAVSFNIFYGRDYVRLHAQVAPVPLEGE